MASTQRPHVDDIDAEVYGLSHPSNLVMGEILALALEVSGQNGNQPVMVAVPSAFVAQRTVDVEQATVPSGSLFAFYSSGSGSDDRPPHSNDPHVLVVPFGRASHVLVELVCSVFIVDAHLIATNDHVFDVHQLIVEAKFAQKPVRIFCDSNSLIRGVQKRNLSLAAEFGANCSVSLKTLEHVPDDFKPVSETRVECIVGRKARFADGDIPGFVDEDFSDDAMLSVIIGTALSALQNDRSLIVITENDDLAKAVAERISEALAEDMALLASSRRFDDRTAVACQVKTIGGGVVFAQVNPFMKEAAATFPRFYAEKRPPILVGSRWRLLYSAVNAPTVLNVVFLQEGKRMFHAEVSALRNMVDARDEHARLITLSDDLFACYADFELSDRIFNRSILSLVESGRVESVLEVVDYFLAFYFHGVNCRERLDELINMRALCNVDGRLELLTCRYLSGYFGVEKRRLLGAAFKSFDFGDLLYNFYLANVFFVDTRDVALLHKFRYLQLFRFPTAKAFGSRIGLFEGRVGGAVYAKMEAAAMVSLVVYRYYNNQPLGEGEADAFDMLHSTEKLQDVISLLQKNLSKTAKIADELFGTAFGNFFRHLDSVCLQFDSSALKAVPGIDVLTLDALHNSGIKTVLDFIHCPDLNRHLGPLACRLHQPIHTLTTTLRSRALSLELKQSTAGEPSFASLPGDDLEVSLEISRELFTTSFLQADRQNQSLCAKELPSLACFEPVQPHEVVIIHTVPDDTALSVARLNPETGDLALFSLAINCCEQCNDAQRVATVLGRCLTSEGVFVSNVLYLARHLALHKLSLAVAAKAHCLGVLCYVVGRDSLRAFGDQYTEKHEEWTAFYDVLHSGLPMTPDAFQSVIDVYPVFSQLVSHHQVLLTRKAINVLVRVYEYGVPYSGFDKLCVAYGTKKSEFPVDVIKAANSNFISREVHFRLADDVGELYRQQGFKRAKLSSSEAATRHQTNPFYAQLAKLRKLNQALDLLDDRHFPSPAGVVYPLITFGDSGRLYTHAPNLQNFAKQLPFDDLPSPRSVIAVDDASELWSVDYSEIELRMAVIMSKDEELLRAVDSNNAFGYIGEKLHVAGYERDVVKKLFYGLLYGMGAGLIAETHELDLDEAKEILKRFNETFTGLKQYRDALSTKATSGALVTNYFSLPVHIDAAKPYAAINAVIQSSAAYILLRAVANFPAKSPIKLLILVHDEVIFKAPRSIRKRVPSIVSHWMVTEIDGMPFPVKFKVGSNWGALEKLLGV